MRAPLRLCRRQEFAEATCLGIFIPDTAERIQVPTYPGSVQCEAGGLQYFMYLGQLVPYEVKVEAFTTFSSTCTTTRHELKLTILPHSSLPFPYSSHRPLLLYHSRLSASSLSIHISPSPSPSPYPLQPIRSFHSLPPHPEQQYIHQPPTHPSPALPRSGGESHARGPYRTFLRRWISWRGATPRQRRRGASVPGVKVPPR